MLLAIGKTLILEIKVLNFLAMCHDLQGVSRTVWVFGTVSAWVFGTVLLLKSYIFGHVSQRCLKIRL
jgi:hypothetical protein